ncbi:hypothetical protein N431DRAFT_353173, partial [Stipitochalara longipes BDJ]
LSSRMMRSFGWGFRMMFFPRPATALFNTYVWPHLIIWNVSRYQAAKKAQAPREIEVFVEEGMAEDGITVLKRASIGSDIIKSCMECMGTGVGFDECAKREGVKVCWQRR